MANGGSQLRGGFVIDSLDARSVFEPKRSLACSTSRVRVGADWRPVNKVRPTKKADRKRSTRNKRRLKPIRVKRSSRAEREISAKLNTVARTSLCWLM